MGQLVFHAGGGIMAIGAVLGLILKLAGMFAWSDLLEEMPAIATATPKGLYSPLNASGGIQYVYSFILGEAYERYAISRNLLTKFRRIRQGYIWFHLLLFVGFFFVVISGAIQG